MKRLKGTFTQIASKCNKIGAWIWQNLYVCLFVKKTKDSKQWSDATNLIALDHCPRVRFNSKLSAQWTQSNTVTSEHCLASFWRQTNITTPGAFWGLIAKSDYFLQMLDYSDHLLKSHSTTKVPKCQNTVPEVSWYLYVCLWPKIHQRALSIVGYHCSVTKCNCALWHH